MKYVLIWILVGGPGDLSSGAAEFDNKAACVAAGDEMRRSMKLAEQRTRRQGFVHEFQCAPKHGS